MRQYFFNHRFFVYYVNVSKFASFEKMIVSYFQHSQLPNIKAKFHAENFNLRTWNTCPYELNFTRWDWESKSVIDRK